MTHDEAVQHVRRSEDEDCDQAMLGYVCDMADAAKRLEVALRLALRFYKPIWTPGEIEEWERITETSQISTPVLRELMRAALAAMPKEQA